MSPLCPLDDEHLPLVVDTLKSKQVRRLYRRLQADFRPR